MPPPTEDFCEEEIPEVCQKHHNPADVLDRSLQPTRPEGQRASVSFTGTPVVLKTSSSLNDPSLSQGKLQERKNEQVEDLKALVKMELYMAIVQDFEPLLCILFRFLGEINLDDLLAYLARRNLWSVKKNCWIDRPTKRKGIESAMAAWIERISSACHDYLVGKKLLGIFIASA